MIVCVSPNGMSSSASDRPADRLAVATVNGVHCFERGSFGWEAVGSALEEHHVGSLVYLADADLLLAGAHSGGFFASCDGGRTWDDESVGLPGARHVFSLAAQRTTEGTVLWAGLEPAALYRSDDLGATWHELPGIGRLPGSETWTFPAPPHAAHVKHVAPHPGDPAMLYVCIEQGALVVTNDGGRSWRELTGWEPAGERWHHDAHRTVLVPSDPSSLYLVSGEGLFRSTDGGAHWSHLTTRFDRLGYPDALFLDPHDERVLYLAGGRTSPDLWAGGASGSAQPGVLRSPDGGATWSELHDGFPELLRGNIEAFAMHVAPQATALYAATTAGEVYAREDVAQAWALAAAGLPPVSKVGHYRKFIAPAAQ